MNSKRMIAGVGQGGLGLPDRDYYLKDDEKTKETLAAYRAHVEKMFALLGDPRSRRRPGPGARSKSRPAWRGRRSQRSICATRSATITS